MRFSLQYKAVSHPSERSYTLGWCLCISHRDLLSRSQDTKHRAIHSIYAEQTQPSTHLAVVWLSVGTEVAGPLRCVVVPPHATPWTHRTKGYERVCVQEENTPWNVLEVIFNVSKEEVLHGNSQ